MKISDISVLFCDAGWRPWIFVKITTDNDLIGYSEVSDSHGSPAGIKAIIDEYKPKLIGKSPNNIQYLAYDFFREKRQTPGGLIQKAWAGIENALWDIKAQHLQVPIYELFGAKFRNRVPVYWSHCGTTRVRAWQVVKQKAIHSLDDLAHFIPEVKKQGFSAIKTNILMFEPEASVYMPGFTGHLGTTDRNPSRAVLHAIECLLETWRSTAGDELEILLDLNFNCSVESCFKIIDRIEPFELMWLEIDCFDPRALQKITAKSKTPICSGENLYGRREFKPYLETHAMHVAMIDMNWNGLLESLKIAHMAEAYEINVAPHNYYSHFSTYMNAQFCAMLPNVRIMEVDVDDVPWKDQLVSEPPRIKNGLLTIPDKPGWGVSLNEDIIAAHPWSP